ncbi:hypothetical protein [Primorskyibacter flagellatus]|uniref:hypothetical protein n=1 Tax=Primorskyibacter flagellatus TaxID=1387277 RepID=UPI001E28C948|nr:hypothetical protein [Primorskyibacter flagellatus]
MMLYKDLISTYGSSFAGKSKPQDDPVWNLAWSEALQDFRSNALDALQQAKVFLLDHAAAAYADTLHDTIKDEFRATGQAAMSYLGEITLPAKVTWVEFDSGALGRSRYERGSSVTVHDDGPVGSGLRGYLIDDRNPDHLRITMFNPREDSKIMDPISALLVKRTPIGRLDYDNVSEDLSRSMVDFRVRIGDPIEKIEALRHIHFVDAGYDLFLPFALFAMLNSPDLGGIIPTPEETFTAKEGKTARKFGKSWLLGAQKSHLTIRIGPKAAAHMKERQARRDFEREMQAARTGPVRHWVSEHERRYKSGKVVLVKGHQRGHEPPPGLATRVMGPRDDAIVSGFHLPSCPEKE